MSKARIMGVASGAAGLAAVVGYVYGRSRDCGPTCTTLDAGREPSRVSLAGWVVDF